MIEEELGSGQRGYNLGPVTSIGSIGSIVKPVRKLRTKMATIDYAKV